MKSSEISSQPLGPPMIGALLRIPWEAVQEHILERLHREGFTDIDPSYLIVVQYPGPQGERPSDLAARLRISKQALNHLLRQLEHLGYLERRPDPDDRRSKRIALTSRGTRAATTIREAVADLETTWADQLGPKRFDQLRTLLRDLGELDQAT
ncbi:MAG TPA: MarR family transcriptional regulator [Gaiellaceae bacterium]